jgi:3-oxoacyl-[acyl-carrier protein] reductase
MLTNKIALITGGTRGIGRAIVELFAQEGCRIAFTYQHAQQEASLLVKELQTKNIEAICIQSNAADFESAHKVINQVVEHFGRIDILVCNAGITRDTLLMRMNEGQWDEVIDTNLKSVFNYCHAVTPQMMRQRSGSIIALSSIVGLSGNAGQVNYAASKAGIIGLIKSLSKELGARNIRANAIAPGFILTDMTMALPETTREEITKNIPMRRCGKTNEVAQVALFLASDMASYVNGEVIKVDGGM